ncbi:MAG: sigma-70 family RNA polymerase sigma factor [Bacteroidota bacterium]
MSNSVSYGKEKEENLLANAKQGDEKAFTEIFHRYDDMVYSFAFKVCRDEEKAKETLQDTFVNVYRKLNQFDGKSKFSTWLYSIVTNNCLMKRRQRKIDWAAVSLDTIANNDENETTEQTTPVLASAELSPLNLIINDELKTQLDSAIQKLPVEYRIVFILRDIEEQSTEEVAAILKISAPAVKSRLHRARAFLREQLQEYVSL